MVHRSATVALGPLETHVVHIVNGDYSAHHSAQWPIAQIQAIAPISVDLKNFLKGILPNNFHSFFAFSVVNSCTKKTG